MQTFGKRLQVSCTRLLNYMIGASLIIKTVVDQLSTFNAFQYVF